VWWRIFPEDIDKSVYYMYIVRRIIFKAVPGIMPEKKDL